MRQYKFVNTILLSNINTKLKTTKFKTRETRDLAFLKFTSWTSQEIPPLLFEPQHTENVKM